MIHNFWMKFGHSNHSAADCAGQKMCLRFFFPGFANRPANSLTLAIELPARMVVFVFEKLYRNRTAIDKNKQE